MKIVSCCRPPPKMKKMKASQRKMRFKKNLVKKVPTANFFSCTRFFKKQNLEGKFLHLFLFYVIKSCKEIFYVKLKDIDVVAKCLAIEMVAFTMPMLRFYVLNFRALFARGKKYFQKLSLQKILFSSGTTTKKIFYYQIPPPLKQKKSCVFYPFSSDTKNNSSLLCLFFISFVYIYLPL
jgi:hypothetical protein